VLVLLALFFFLMPALTEVHELADPNLRVAGIPRSAWKLHENLSPRFEQWARERLDSKRAAELPIYNISGTEWPLFGSVFYLWGTESLQDEMGEKPRARNRGPQCLCAGRHRGGDATGGGTRARRTG